MKMNKLNRKMKLRDTKGQDMIEYALMAGLISLAGAAVLPGIELSIDRIFDLVRNVMRTASTQGS